MEITNTNIVGEINHKLAALKLNPRGPFANGNCRKTCLNHEAVCHSLRIENPKATRAKSHTGREQTKLFNNMLSAFYWGKAALNNGAITEDLIKELAGRIDPNYKDNINYRELMESVRPQNATWTPVYPEKIPKEMGIFISYLDDINWNSIQSVVDDSCYAHLHLVRIHPFPDINGRTSRMLQNLILDKVGLPSPTIYEGERFHYFQLLDDAVNGWRQRTGDSSPVASKEERSFYNFMAGKISSTLDKVLEHH